jgi:tetratricopeptide (TPR) repeat protein
VVASTRRAARLRLGAFAGNAGRTQIASGIRYYQEPIVVAGNVHAFAGHVDLAIAKYQRALAIEPTFGLANHFLGRAYLAKGDHGRAIQQLRKSNELLAEVPFSLGDLGYALAVAGVRDEAERMLAAIIGKRSEGLSSVPDRADSLGSRPARRSARLDRTRRHRAACRRALLRRMNLDG